MFIEMKKLLLLSCAFFTLYSCRYILDEQTKREEIESYISPFRGTWVGTYAGDQSGELKIDVAKNGYTSVTKTSQNIIENSFISGMVRDDGILQNVSLKSGFTLFGNLKVNKGTWGTTSANGTWTLVKK